LPYSERSQLLSSSSPELMVSWEVLVLELLPEPQVLVWMKQLSEVL